MLSLSHNDTKLEEKKVKLSGLEYKKVGKKYYNMNPLQTFHKGEIFPQSAIN